MVVHGANDPRVPVNQAEQIVSAARRNGAPVWYIRFAGEGHGGWKSDHDRYLKEAQILFLKRYLLGK